MPNLSEWRGSRQRYDDSARFRKRTWPGPSLPTAYRSPLTTLIDRHHQLEREASAASTDEGEHLPATTLSEPGDLLLGDDRRTLRVRGAP
ncbi:hypothetical protein [Streptomyces sp. NPDC000229]|uniref:hypothetical protein n=1 Tax=Streptomyces sp. NPDC000229 TaxID=3154247 RepID=UPI003332FA57